MKFSIRSLLLASFALTLTAPLPTAAEVMSFKEYRGIAEAEQTCLAQVIYYEARGEPEVGKKAVAAVVLNRKRHADFPHTVCRVVQHRVGGICQFPWWCRIGGRLPRPNESWTAARRLAAEMIAGHHPDPTGGALYFQHHAAGPSLRKQNKRLVAVGQHVFYR